MDSLADPLTDLLVDLTPSLSCFPSCVSDVDTKVLLMDVDLAAEEVTFALVDSFVILDLMPANKSFFTERPLILFIDGLLGYTALSL